MNVLKKKMKFLATKLSSLQSELMVSKEILQSASLEVDNMFKTKYFPEIPIEQEKEKSEEIKEYSEDEAAETSKEKKEEKQHEDLLDATSETPADPEVRKMFKKIATQCHPDKLAGLEDGFEKKKKQQLYEKARKALQDNDVLLMTDVANDLDIETPEITETQLKSAEKKIISIKKELHHIESTLVWHWFFCENQEQKENILNKLFELMYANNPRS
tara:strand:+ start:1100 stop:1747 length:648 start_codon:yes stop_codon:yes gene_type:complete